MQKEFITPPDHVRFLAKKLFGDIGRVRDGAIAYLQPGGGGPQTMHAHPQDHVFIVVEGQAKILLKGRAVILSKNESFRVSGQTPHSVWNDTDGCTVMLGLTVESPVEG